MYPKLVLLLTTIIAKQLTYFANSLTFTGLNQYLDCRWTIIPVDL
jgi:hypothetical protein